MDVGGDFPERLEARPGDLVKDADDVVDKFDDIVLALGYLHGDILPNFCPVINSALTEITNDLLAGALELGIEGEL